MCGRLGVRSVAANGENATPPRAPPFPHLSCCLERKESVKGARFLRGLRTLDRFFPFWKMDPEGKGAGGLRGFDPLAEYEAAPHARLGRAGRWGRGAWCVFSGCANANYRSLRNYWSPIRPGPGAVGVWVFAFNRKGFCFFFFRVAAIPLGELAFWGLDRIG